MSTALIFLLWFYQLQTVINSEILEPSTLFSNTLDDNILTSADLNGVNPFEKLDTGKIIRKFPYSYYAKNGALKLQLDRDPLFSMPLDAQEQERRRSLMANFMRFGRGPHEDFMRFGKRQPEDFRKLQNEQNTEVNRDQRGDNFMRFGRSSHEDFMRFGRSPHEDFMRFGRDHGSDFLRFGRDAEDFMRLGRDPGSVYLRLGRAGPDGFMRLGRGDEFMRLGRTTKPNKFDTISENFMRFGRMPTPTVGDLTEDFMRFGKSIVRPKKLTNNTVAQQEKHKGSEEIDNFPNAANHDYVY